MNIRQRRFSKTQQGIFGNYFDEQNNIICSTGEHSYDCVPKLPDGTYTCKRRFSPHFGYDVFQITNVPGHDWIEIHLGNDCQIDSDGCTILGTHIEGSIIMESKIAFDAFMKLQDGVDEFTLTVS